MAQHSQSEEMFLKSDGDAAKVPDAPSPRSPNARAARLLVAAAVAATAAGLLVALLAAAPPGAGPGVGPQDAGLHEVVELGEATAFKVQGRWRYERTVFPGEKVIIKSGLEESSKKESANETPGRQLSDRGLTPANTLRVILQLLVQEFQGSTALQMLLMSSPHVSHLCKNRKWECEPRSKDYSYLSTIWDLSRPILLKKDMAALMEERVAEDHKAMTAANWVPKAMRSAGIDHVTQAYILMWRPMCLYAISHQANEWGIGKREMFRYKYMLRLIQQLRDAKARLFVLSYAQLLLEVDRTVKRLEEFMPGLRPLNPDFVPKLGRDVFWGNEWKAEGSIKSYAGIFRQKLIDHNLRPDDVLHAPQKCTWASPHWELVHTPGLANQLWQLQERLQAESWR